MGKGWTQFQRFGLPRYGSPGSETYSIPEHLNRQNHQTPATTCQKAFLVAILTVCGNLRFHSEANCSATPHTQPRTCPSEILHCQSSMRHAKTSDPKGFPSPKQMGVAENRGPQYSTPNSKTLIHMAPKIRYPHFRKLPHGSRLFGKRVAHRS